MGHIFAISKKNPIIYLFINQHTFRNAKEIHLNAEYKDTSLFRNKLSLDFFSEIGALAPQSRYVFLKINGKNEGVYLELESVDECFLAKRNLPKGRYFMLWMGMPIFP